MKEFTRAELIAALPSVKEALDKPDYARTTDDLTAISAAKQLLRCRQFAANKKKNVVEPKR